MSPPEPASNEAERERALFAKMLSELEGSAVRVLGVESLVGDRAPTEMKRMGYGVPLLVRYRTMGSEKRVVFRTQGANWFGHDRRSDRACLSLLAADTFADQPRHIAVRDVGAIRGDELISLRDSAEFYLVTNYVAGTLYADDLRRVESRGHCVDLDLARVDTLARHLAEVHAVVPASNRPQVYTRAIRDLIGSGEGIFGIVDSFPPDFEHAKQLFRIEELAVQWRWRIGRQEASLLRRTHGDFHPYNILFREGVDFTALDASRGGAGDPADDLAALSINYLFGGLRHPEAWPNGFGLMWRAFYKQYISYAKNERALENMAPFMAWRALVLSSPAWYPDIAQSVRAALLGLAVHWLEGTPFDPETIEASLRSVDVTLPTRPAEPHARAE
jgi:hypothetical protein